ncbi:hypothetical protein K491DRAFT_709618 [Lophiostoma macrostomum CBS 122681]|uniref:C2H2-type domain-containing protein n=1 Tax=Lophiostoma macrostomum CBS 122681 TaxID=1314788 RepID=A0A6A6TUX4_9PLEO|nr:hypothetical protein K491DRAFT_709618 [Lophiostoma macrostomum CBS 122681]
MSQPNNYSTFNFTEPFYGSESSQSTGNPSFPTWSSKRTRPVVNTAPSPSPSVQTARSAPVQRSSNMPGFGHPALIRRDAGTDQGLSYLAVPSMSRSRPQPQIDPISRFYNEDSPWSAERMRTSNVPFSRLSLNQPSLDLSTWRESPGSEVDSMAQRSDSGYHTFPPHSITGRGPDTVEQELPSDVTLKVGNMEVNSAGSDIGDVYRTTGSAHDQASQYSGRSTTRSAGGNGKEIRCLECNETSKCKSDYKKHMLRHNKPYKCHISNCRRGGKGFTTINDLNRHKKSVHRIGALENSYQCASETCRSREKIWPRLDNFKQHIHRMHKDEDEQDLIQRSQYITQEPPPSSESLSVAPMETTLAGIGTEKQFSNSSNELDDPIPEISLTPDQDLHQWSSFDPSTHVFAMDVDQTSHNFYHQVSRKASVNPHYNFQSQDISNPFGGTDLPSTAQARRPSFQRLETLADAASTQVTDKPAQRLPPQLSSAPQTKADQQRQALQKFSKLIVRDIQNASSNEPGDLENVIMRVLSSTLGKKDVPTLRQPSTQTSNQSHLVIPSPSEDLSMDTLTKKEALKATQAMNNLIKKAPNIRPRQSSSFSVHGKRCEHCPVTVARPCDMRKHMKRHTRPYGCTYPKCHKRFGAKSDWKRHENSQHFQLESFRCQLPSPSSQIPCGELFYRVEGFRSHLEQEHKMVMVDAINHEVKNRRIGKNGQGQFWCGFCRKIVRLEKKRNAAWDERFDHIDNHFSKEGKKIEAWLCIEGRKTKGEVWKDVDKDSFDEEDIESFAPEDEQTSSDAAPENGLSPSLDAQAISSASPDTAPPPLLRKRPANFLSSNAASKRPRSEISKYCNSVTAKLGPGPRILF